MYVVEQSAMGDIAYMHDMAFCGWSGAAETEGREIVRGPGEGMDYWTADILD